jgi:acyl carrier protein
MKAIAELDEIVVSAIAVACNIERSAIAVDANMLELGIDSITMTAIVAQVQASYDVQLETDDVVELLNAPRVADVLSLMKKALERSGVNNCVQSA